MNNFAALFRSFIIYAVCVVLAIWLGFLLATPLTFSQLTIYGVLAFTLFFPLLLRWHYPLLLLSWNMAAVVFFLPGHPSLYLLMVAFSLGISVLQRMLSKESRFISVPQVTLPLLCMVAVIIFTAKMTGLGVRSLGSDEYGGKKYFYLMGGILGYFALTARRIPLERKNLYLGLFFLGGVTNIIGDLLPLVPGPLHFIYWVFAPNLNFMHAQGPDSEMTRLNGATFTAALVVPYMLARYGIRGIFLSGKPLRWMTLFAFLILGLFGGFRGFIISSALLFALQFYLEGLHRTRLMLALSVAGILGGLALIPLAPHLPYTFQRALSFLPLKMSTAARMDAQDSWDWRVQMWQAILPEVPQHLLLGEGYVLSSQNFDFMASNDVKAFAQNQSAVLAEDFHSGPLSVVIPFGIWGCLAFLWFLAAGTRVLYLNYRYSNPALKTVNTLLFAAFVAQSLYFLFAFGDLSGDMFRFTGLLGMGVSLNGGVRRPVRTVQSTPVRKKTQRFPKLPPPPVPAFQRHR
ncbi:MAG: hypothetical protein WBN22_00385 [Verrucomicrobiia bacterium]